MIEIKDPLDFFRLQVEFKRIAFSQSEGWYNYLKAQGKEMVFFADHDPKPNIMCWGIIEKVPLTGKKILRISGDVLSEVREDHIRSFYSGFKDSVYVGVEIDSNSNYSVEYEIGIRRAGFLRPLGSFSCPLTIEVDLSAEMHFNRNWRGNLRKAEKNNLEFKEITSPSSEDINSFVSLFNEMAGFKKLSFNLTYNSISELMNSDDFRIFMVSDEKRLPLSAILTYVKDDLAYNIFAANSMLSRKYGAPRFVFKELCELLKLEQIKVLDLGRIPPSDHETDNVYVFKKGTGGNIVQYNGEWTYYKSKIVELAVFLYKWFKLQKQRY